MTIPGLHKPALAGSPKSRTRVLVVTDVPFWTPDRGSSRRIESLIEHLQKHFELSICFVGEMPTDQWNRAERKFRVPLFGPGQPSLFARRLAGFLQRFKSSKTRNDRNHSHKSTNDRHVAQKRLNEFRSGIIGQFVGQLTRNLEIDVVLIQYITLSYVSEYVRQHCPGTRTIVDTHDVMHLRNAEFLAAGSKSWLNIDADEERAAIKSCDAAVAISEEDQSALRALAPEALVLKATFAIANALAPVRETPTTSNPTIGFIGTDGDANRMGLAIFFRECWPKLTRHHGTSIHIRIGGPIDPGFFAIEPQPNVEFVGSVENLTDFYGSIDIAINPATIRSGFKIKSLESLSRGIPLVTTTAGIAGMSQAIGRGAFVADEWHDFANAIIRLIEDRSLRQRTSMAALETVRKYFSPETVYADLVSWIGTKP